LQRERPPVDCIVLLLFRDVELFSEKLSEASCIRKTNRYTTHVATKKFSERLTRVVRQDEEKNDERHQHKVRSLQHWIRSKDTGRATVSKSISCRLMGRKELGCWLGRSIMKEPMSLRLGPLAGPLLQRCERTGETPSDVLRLALAKELGLEAPSMPQGFAAMSEKTAAKARKKSAKTRRAAKSA
jgi:hypothetical protein